MARQYYKDSTTGQMKPLGVKVEDTLPVGTIVEYNGQNIPEGWVDIGNGKIEKEYQVIPTNALLENGDSDSATNGYVAEYINNHSVVVSPTEPSGSARKKVWKQHGTNVNDKEYILNDNDVYEEFNSNKQEVIDITSLSGGATINSTYWRNRLVKQGKICHLELAFAPNSTSNITILQLPAGFYSSGNTATIGLLMRNSLLGKMVITNGGAVQVQVGSESGNTWSLNATWIVD